MCQMSSTYRADFNQKGKTIIKSGIKTGNFKCRGCKLGSWRKVHFQTPGYVRKAISLIDTVVSTTSVYTPALDLVEVLTDPYTDH